jgi:hypothetical protein
LDLAGGTVLIIRRLIVPLIAAVVVAYASQGSAQVIPNDPAFPPVPGAAPARAAPASDPAFPPVRRAAPAADSAFPPVNGSAPVASIGAPPSGSFPVNGAAPLAATGFQRPPGPPPGGGGGEACMKGFMPLREEAEKRGKMIKAASDRHASPQEACGLIKSFGVAELKMIKYVEANSSKCGIPPQVSEQLRNGHKNTDGMEQKVCAAAQQAETRAPAGPSLSDVLGSAAALPEANKKGGATFDTLNGNVLTR